MMTKEKLQEMDKAIMLLTQLFNGLTNNSGEVMVGRLSQNEVITVMIRGGGYEINVECEDVAAMIKEVVNQVICKI